MMQELISRSSEFRGSSGPGSFLRHCLSSCMISDSCGGANIARLLGHGREIDWPWDMENHIEDIWANEVGIGCSENSNSSCLSCCRCRRDRRWGTIQPHR